MAVKHSSEINIRVGLDENRVPEELFGSADDGAIDNMEAKAVFLSAWASSQKDTDTINLWTKDMLMDDMKRMYHQTFISMADGYERATEDTALAADMRDFARYFGEKSGLISPEK